MASARSTPDGSATSSDPDLEPIDPDEAAPHPLGPRDVIEALASYSRLILTAVVVVVLTVGAYLLGRSRAPEILRSPTATTGVLWACNRELTGVVSLAPGPVVIVTPGGIELQATVVTHGQVTVPVDEPPRSGARVRVRRGATELQVPVLTCAERPLDDP